MARGLEKVLKTYLISNTLLGEPHPGEHYLSGRNIRTEFRHMKFGTWNIRTLIDTNNTDTFDRAESRNAFEARELPKFCFDIARLSVSR